MTNKYSKHVPSDITFNYNVDKFVQLSDLWQKNFDESDFLVDLLLMLALEGVKNESRVPLDSNDNKGTRTISRTVYQRNEVYMESIIGLINILSNTEYTDDIMLNQIAFAKMNTHNQPFLKLPNVQTFYEYMVGGIEHLYELVFENGSSVNDVAITLFDIITDEDEEYINMIDAMLLEESTKED